MPVPSFRIYCCYCSTTITFNIRHIYTKRCSIIWPKNSRLLQCPDLLQLRSKMFFFSFRLVHLWLTILCCRHLCHTVKYHNKGTSTYAFIVQSKYIPGDRQAATRKKMVMLPFRVPFADISGCLYVQHSSFFYDDDFFPTIHPSIPINLGKQKYDKYMSCIYCIFGMVCIDFFCFLYASFRFCFHRNSYYFVYLWIFLLTLPSFNNDTDAKTLPHSMCSPIFARANKMYSSVWMRMCVIALG